MTTVTSTIVTKLDSLVHSTKTLVENRKEQIKRALDNSSMREFSSLSNQLHYAYGKLGVYRHLLRIAYDSSTEAEAITRCQDAAFSILLRGESDTWSGRGNDAIRSNKDGERDAIDTLSWTLKIKA